jgi:protein AroM
MTTNRQPAMDTPGPVIAAVTIGQSPREDTLPELQRYVPHARFIEAGALDLLDDAAIAALAPAGDDFPLVTRLRDRRSVMLGEHAVTPLVQDAIRRVEGEADLVIVLCTGEFVVSCRKPLVYPGRVLTSTVMAVHGGRPIAVLVPHEGQVPPQIERWRERGIAASLFAVSPYAGADFAAVGRRAREAGATLIAMDCLGYTLAMKSAVAASSGLPTILARSLVARVAAELVER